MKQHRSQSFASGKDRVTETKRTLNNKKHIKKVVFRHWKLATEGSDP